MEKHVKYILEISPDNTDKLIQELIIANPDIKIGHFSEELLEKKSGKAAGLDQYPLNFGRQKNLKHILFRLYNTVNKTK